MTSFHKIEGRTIIFDAKHHDCYYCSVCNRKKEFTTMSCLVHVLKGSLRPTNCIYDTYTTNEAEWKIVPEDE